MESGESVFVGDGIGILGGWDIENILEYFDMVCDDSDKRFCAYRFVEDEFSRDELRDDEASAGI